MIIIITIIIVLIMLYNIMWVLFIRVHLYNPKGSSTKKKKKNDTRLT